MMENDFFRTLSCGRELPPYNRVVITQYKYISYTRKIEEQ